MKRNSWREVLSSTGDMSSMEPSFIEEFKQSYISGLLNDKWGWRNPDNPSELIIVNGRRGVIWKGLMEDQIREVNRIQDIDDIYDFYDKYEWWNLYNFNDFIEEVLERQAR